MSVPNRSDPFLYPMTDAELAEWGQWLKDRPETIRDLALRFPPNGLFRIKASKHYCVINSFMEDGTVTVRVTCAFQMLAFDRVVFGLKPDELEPAPLPEKGVRIGCTQHGIGTFDEARLSFREVEGDSDIWVPSAEERAELESPRYDECECGCCRWNHSNDIGPCADTALKGTGLGRMLGSNCVCSGFRFAVSAKDRLARLEEE